MNGFGFCQMLFLGSVGKIDQHAMQRVTIKVRRELRDGGRGEPREGEKERRNLHAFKSQVNYFKYLVLYT